MSKYILILFLTVSAYSINLQAQNGQYTIGARASGMANASVTLGDEWAMHNNIGALAQVERSSVMFTYQNRYGVSEFNTLGGGYIKPLFNGVAGIGVFRFGDSFFNEQKINLGFSNQFGLVSLGANVNYLQVNIEGLGSKGILLLDFGGRATITDQLIFGAVSYTHLTLPTKRIV